jgi:plastocyanin
MKMLSWAPGATIVMVIGIGSLIADATRTAYQADAAIDGTTVQGRVTFRGAPPPPGTIQVLRDRAYCGETVPNETLLVDHGSKGIAGVVVSLEGVTKGKPLGDAPTVLDNSACRFHPRVGAIARGSQLEIRNTDPVLHNTHIWSEGKTFLNIALPPGNAPIRKTIANVGTLDVRCDAHKFMQASVHVFAHPYFAVTDGAGRFELTKVPPGTYRLQVRHETLGAQEQTIQVPAKGVVTVNPIFDGQR